MMNSLQLAPTDLVSDASPCRVAWNQLGIDSAIVDLNLLDNTYLVCICDSWISSLDDVSFVGVATLLWLIGLQNPHEIVCHR